MEKEAMKNALASIRGKASQNQTDAEEMVTSATEQEEEELLNSIKDEELRDALRDRQNRNRRGRPRKDEVLRAKQEALYVRFCTLVLREQVAKVKEICFRETLTLKEVIGAIFGQAIKTYEEKYGKIEPHNVKDASSLFEK